MQLASRKLLDRAFTASGVFSLILMSLAVVVFIAPIAVRGTAALVFRGTIEHRRLQLEQFERGNREVTEAETRRAAQSRQHVYDVFERFEKESRSADGQLRAEYARSLRELKSAMRALLGPFPGERRPALLRDQYGQTRWDKAQAKLHTVLFTERYDYSNPREMGRKVVTPRAEEFRGTSLEPLFAYLENHLQEMLLPRWTFYWGFLSQDSRDAHFFGGIWPELLGTFYLTIGALLFAVPLGVITAIYLVEYAPRDSRVVGLIRTCVSTLAGVPSIVFGLFGLAFFINTLHVSHSKSVLAGSMTLAILILPLVIRSAEEALRAVPDTYKEAAMSLGATRWRTVLAVLLPAALPGVLTGIVISMGRAAGETAPIIFTAAVSVGSALTLGQTLSEGTPALPWNIYSLCSEHQAVDEIRHVQYGMVFTLVVLVLLLSSVAVLMRARVSRKLRG